MALHAGRALRGLPHGVLHDPLRPGVPEAAVRRRRARLASHRAVRRPHGHPMGVAGRCRVLCANPAREARESGDRHRLTPMPKLRPYLYYDQTVSLCDECLRRVEAKHVIRDGEVWMYKWCPEHGHRKALVATDAAYWRLGREVYIKPPE